MLLCKSVQSVAQEFWLTDAIEKIKERDLNDTF